MRDASAAVVEQRPSLVSAPLSLLTSETDVEMPKIGFIGTRAGGRAACCSLCEVISGLHPPLRAAAASGSIQPWARRAVRFI
ncbi:hypothetical protein J6590_027954 [Homalodisca vitripennis]|nr:hypothetical protein J6590_027954 [Homalodisca vitripennis]